MNVTSETTLIIVAILGLAAGFTLAWMMTDETIRRLKASMNGANIRGDKMTLEVERLEEYSTNRAREALIASESSDRWRDMAMRANEALLEAESKLKTERRRSAALLGHNRKYRRVEASDER